MTHLPVLLEPIDQNGYRARTGEPLVLSAEGGTEAEALRNLQELIDARLSTGTRIVSLPIPPSDNPWLQVTGMYKDDPLFDEWQEAIAERRRQLNADPDVP